LDGTTLRGAEAEAMAEEEKMRRSILKIANSEEEETNDTYVNPANHHHQ